MSGSWNLLLGGESDKNAAEEGRLLIAKVTSRYLSELTSLPTNMNTFVNHICISDKNLFPAFKLCWPLIPLNIQSAARPAIEALAKIFSSLIFCNSIFTTCLHNIIYFETKILDKTVILTKRRSVSFPQKYSHHVAAGKTKNDRCSTGRSHS